jgi:hypothetical protein
LRLGRGGQAQERGEQCGFDGLFISLGHWAFDSFLFKGDQSRFCRAIFLRLIRGGLAFTSVHQRSAISYYVENSEPNRCCTRIGYGVDHAYCE